MTSNFAYHGSIGDSFADRAEDGTYNAYVDRPAMLDLVGEVAGQRVLDAGCGPGLHAAALAERGASVVGLEGSAALVEHARARLGDGAEVHQHDLNLPLDTLADGSFDGALCALVLHHLHDRPQFLSEVSRVIRPGGWFVLSTSHPTSDWRHFEGSYFSEEWVDLDLRDGKHTVHLQRMTLEMIFDELLGAGFTVERLVEPRPAEALRSVDAIAYERLTQAPSFIAFRLRRA